ncbi:MAG: alpha/beta hydrolase [Anaerolineae bacterium]|jgi:pimeloyl-ACP methyl ester carboxylesterase
MRNVRRYGRPPFRVAVVHGGPGAGGEMAPVARELASCRGVLEPIQTARSLDGQVEELRTILEVYGEPPVTLVGFSWGAWLSFIVAARYPALIAKLILVGSGPFETRYVAQLGETRRSRLSEEERAAFERTLEALEDPACEDKDGQLARLGALTWQTDQFDPIPDAEEALDRVEVRGQLFQDVWKDADQLRRSGQLLEMGRRIECPVIAIHGDYDPHPAQGVERPLTGVLKRFRFVMLEHCGHKPWVEREARGAFYEVLGEALCSPRCSESSHRQR